MSALTPFFAPASPSAATMAKYWITRFVLTVLPAPDSPLRVVETALAWVTWEKAKVCKSWDKLYDKTKQNKNKVGNQKMLFPSFEIYV